MTQIITRKEAIARGIQKYFTGVPCKNGHIVERYTVTSSCTQCLCSYQKKLRTRLNCAKAHEAWGYVNLDTKINPIDLSLMRDVADLLNESRNTGDLTNIEVISRFIHSMKLAKEFK